MFHRLRLGERTSLLIAEITESAGSRSAGITRVSDAVAGMDEGTRRNAAIVEPSAAAASSLAVQARSPAGTMARFRPATEA